MKPYLLALIKNGVFLGITVVMIISQQAHSKQVIDKIVVSVNNEAILESDLAEYLKRIQSRGYQELFGAVDPAIANNRDALIEHMIAEKIINQQVKKLDFTASDQEVEGQIRAVTKRTGITKAQLGERLKQLGVSMEEYHEALRRQIERKNLVEREIRPNMEVTDEQLRRYYQRITKPGDIEKQYKIAHILVENKTKAGLPAEQRVKQIWQEITKKPGEFEKLVKDYSDDKTTAESGGLLGDFTLSSLIKEFRDIVPKTPVGSLTKPIRTSAGFHIVKVLQATAVNFNTLPKEKKEALRNQLVSSELENRMNMWLERKKGESHIRRVKGQG
ncbi:MAG: peptidylprolyl isomerase [Deltaproteobacteria bacterium]|nr:peptidylprolyl isomerase [Deltaproteobacteria bacterium]